MKERKLSIREIIVLLIAAILLTLVARKEKYYEKQLGVKVKS